MYKKILLFLILVAPFSGFCQQADEVIMTIDDRPFSKDEFVRLYRKNNLNLMDEKEKKTPEEYIDLFINYKLKVVEAEEMMMDTLPSFVAELKKYRTELAQPYLADVSFTEEMIKTAYFRETHEVKASHLLLRLDENATPADTLRVFNRIMELRNEIENGADFNEMAKAWSEDPSAKQNDGLLGYFSGFRMVFPFEDAAYKTAVGEVSMPVRTQFGYHLIKVHDIRPTQGQMKVAHIMKRITPTASEETVNKLKQTMDSLEVLLKNGADFAELARNNSDDKRSSGSGGEMPWFSSGNMIPEFAEASFALKNDGDISPAIRTPYGWHIIKRLEHKPVPPLDEMRDLLTERIRKNPEISQHNQESFVGKLKDSWHYSEEAGALEELKKQVPTLLNGNHIHPEKLEEPEMLLFKIDLNKFTFADFANFIKSYEFTPEKQTAGQIENLYRNFVANKLIAAENEHLEDKHPDFKYLMQEYHDGILLFNLSEKKIWNAAATDSVGLNAFYLKNTGKYLWDERFKGWIIDCKTQEVHDFIDEILATDDQISKEELEDRINLQFKNQATIEKGIFTKGDNALVDYLVWNEPKPENYNGELQFIRGDKVQPKPKTLDEVRGLYISDYQNYLENEWVKELRKKHKVKVNKKLLKTIEPV